MLDGNNQVRRMDSKLLTSSPCRADPDRLSTVSARSVSGPSPVGSCSHNVMGVATAAKDEEFAVMLVVQYTRPLPGSGASSQAKTGEPDENALLDAQLSVTLPGRDLRSKRDHNSSLSVRHGGAASDALWRTRSLMPLVAAAQWRSATSSARVGKTGSQSCMVSETRCRAKLHCIFNHAQRQSRDGRFFLLLDGSDQVVGSQIARLSSLGIVILSEVLSPGFDLNSSTVRNVLRCWVAHGDIAAVWMTQPQTSSTAACLPKTCHQANVVGFYAEFSSDTPRQSFVHWATNSRCQWICALLAYRSRNVIRCSLSMFPCTCS